MKTNELDPSKQILYKSQELHPQAKLAVETGKVNAIKVLDRLEYLQNLTLPRTLQWMGETITATPLDKQTAIFVRDHPVYSNVRRLIARGTAHQYGKVLLEGQHATMSLIGAASAIGLIQETETGDHQITRKKEIGLDNKHADELVSEFHDMQDSEQTEEYVPAAEDHETAFMMKMRDEEEKKPPLKPEHQKQTPHKKGGKKGLASKIFGKRS